MNRLALLVPLAAVLACVPKTSPDQGRYACLTAADCGAGFDCKPQYVGGALCFKAGTCADAEVCNGSDDNCDGRVDETFPGKNDGCDTGLKGVCAVGLKDCQSGMVTCVQQKQTSAETCNTLDDDCNGQVDDGFDLSTDGKNCGRCGNVCNSGTSCLAGTCHETACGDGLDNDQNDAGDCADPSCLGRACLDTSTPPWNCGTRLDGGPLPDAGPADAGADGGVDAGFVGACVPPESACANGADDDGDGLADCADPDCDGKTCASGTLCAQRTCPGPG